MANMSVPIDQVSRELALIARRPGWQITKSWRHDDAAAATIEKDGVVLAFSRFRAECDETVRLRHPVHPPVALYPFRDPTIGDVLDAIGVAWTAETSFVSVADHLSAVKRHLRDPAAFRRRVLYQAGALHATYEALGRMSAGDELRRTLAARHGWLENGVPSFDALLVRPRTADAERLRQATIAVVLLALGIAMTITRWS